jgi:hypothetical protein
MCDDEIRFRDRDGFEPFAPVLGGSDAKARRLQAVLEDQKTCPVRIDKENVVFNGARLLDSHRRYRSRTCIISQNSFRKQ